jgi:hypothetical protein
MSQPHSLDMAPPDWDRVVDLYHIFGDKSNEKQPSHAGSDGNGYFAL